MKTLIAELATSEKSGHTLVSTDDIFLYSKGMVAIGAVARAFLAMVPDIQHSEAVVYGLVVPTQVTMALTK